MSSYLPQALDSMLSLQQNPPLPSSNLDDYVLELYPIVSLSKEFEFKDGFKYKQLSICTNQPNTQQKIGIKMSIDISGSMAGTRLGTVIHSAKVIVESSNENIYISIDLFDTGVRVLCDFIPMTLENKTFLLDELNKVITGGCTNLCAALDSIFQMSNETKLIFPIKAILLTDGEPNIKELSEYESIIRKYSIEGKFRINSLDIFGVGNNLNSYILKYLTTITGGIFSYISGPEMSGEIFANYIANIFTTLFFGGIFRFELGDAQIIEETEFIKKDSDGIYTVDIGCLQNGQEKTFLLKSRGEITIESGIFICIDIKNTSQRFIYSTELILTEEKNVISEMMKYDIFLFLSTIYNLGNVPITDSIFSDLDELYLKYQPYSSTNSQVQKYLNDLINDSDSNKGQIKKALQSYITVRYRSIQYEWGYYYIWALYFCYKNKITINGKDESTQSFSGEKAANLVSDFCSTFERIEYTGYADSRVEVTTSYSPAGIPQRSISSHSRICFRGDSLVELKSGEFCRIDEVISGTELKAGTVKYIIKSICYEKLWNYRSVFGTSNHPIKVDGTWKSLKDCHGAVELELVPGGEFVYSLCIENFVKSFEIHGIEVATFGHGCLDETENENGALASTFWGITILSILDGLDFIKVLENGILTLTSKDYLIRDKKTGWCKGLYYNQVQHY